MARRNYKGIGGKSIWENANFKKGVRYTDEPLNEGTLNMLSNWDIGSTGVSMKPRKPFYSMTFKMDSLDSPIAFTRDTIMFSPRQQSDKHYFISLGGERYPKEEIYVVDNSNTEVDASIILDAIYVIDGDTIVYNDTSYRLLGIDAPDKEDDPIGNTYKYASRDYLKELLANNTTEHKSLVLRYDKNSDTDLGFYGRTLVWLIIIDHDNSDTETNLNGQMLYDGYARIYGEYGEGNPTEVHTLDYDELSGSELIVMRDHGRQVAVNNNNTQTLEVPAAWGLMGGIIPAALPVIINTVSEEANISVFSKHYATTIKSFQEYPESIGIPTIDIAHEPIVNLSQMYTDNNIPFGSNIEISLNNIVHQSTGYDYDYRGEYKPWVRYDDIDGIAMLVTIKSDGVEIYTGLATLQYSVPLDGNIPQFDKAYFKFETYNENVYEIRFEDLDNYSPNLLDTTLDELQSYYGDEAIDEGYDDLELRYLKIINTDGELITKMNYNSTYTLVPVIAVPTIPKAIDVPDGYAIKWEFFDSDPEAEGIAATSIDWHMAFDRDGSASAYPDARTTLTNKDPLLAEFNEGIYAKFYIQLAQVVDGEVVLYGTNEESIVNEYVPYVTTEVAAQIYQHGQELNKCTGIAYYEGRLVLYGNPNAANILYLSDYDGNASYFPLKWALDQFNEDVIHVHTHNNSLIVFTQTDIYIAYEAVTDEVNETTGIVATIAMSNITIKGHNRNTVRSIGKDVLFMSQDKMNLLRPNPYVTDVSDMYLTSLSTDIANLLEDPTDHVITRLQYYGVVGEDLLDWKPQVENFVAIKENEIWLYMSVYLDLIGQEFMFICIYDTIKGVWTTYDTIAYTHPYQTVMFNSTEGSYTLSRNHHTRNGGTTLLIDEAINLWDFDDSDGSLFDHKAVKAVDDTFVFNSCLTTDDQTIIDSVRHPLLVFISTGYPNISNHLNKRFHKLYLEIVNKDSIEIPMLIEFELDGKIRQTSKTIRLSQNTDVADPAFGTIYSIIERTPTQLFKGGLTFETWLLGFTPFKATGVIRLEIGISGRGRSAKFDMGFVVKGKFEIYKYGLIYKEQTVR